MDTLEDAKKAAISFVKQVPFFTEASLRLGYGTSAAEYVMQQRQVHKGEDGRYYWCGGCYLCCDKCNFDTHFCPGCGTNLPHSESVCEECKEL